ncbi:MAG: hypothetical protein AB7P44_08295 [Steroidobacteraceae bacterium]
MASVRTPFLTAYDPIGSTEGTLDPVGVFQIVDQLGTLLVPAVRERMQRVRFLTAMAVGVVVAEGLADDPSRRDSAPFLVWEWLVIESFLRTLERDENFWGVHGSDVVQQAVDQYEYVDARSYLKTPRIFGFNGVYKRLGIHLGIVNLHLGPAQMTEPLVDAWARDRGYGGFNDARPLLRRWTAAVERSLGEKPPRTRAGWSRESWAEMAQAFAPGGNGAREKRALREMLRPTEDQRLGALPEIWDLQARFEGEFLEEELHEFLAEMHPRYRPLLQAIQAYESFIRALQDSFDLLLAEGAQSDSRGYEIVRIAKDTDFVASTKNLHQRFEEASEALGRLEGEGAAIRGLFEGRFGRFSEPLESADIAKVLCEHHETVQRGKSADGKRPWFDRVGPDRIHVRQQFRKPRRPMEPNRYVGYYRGRPIRRFYFDLS